MEANDSEVTTEIEDRHQEREEANEVTTEIEDRHQEREQANEVTTEIEDRHQEREEANEVTTEIEDRHQEREEANEVTTEIEDRHQEREEANEVTTEIEDRHQEKEEAAEIENIQAPSVSIDVLWKEIQILQFRLENSESFYSEQITITQFANEAQEKRIHQLETEVERLKQGQEIYHSPIPVPVTAVKRLINNHQHGSTTKCRRVETGTRNILLT